MFSRLFVFLLLVGLVTNTATAQEPDLMQLGETVLPPDLRLMCLDTGCFVTPLSDEDLALAFPEMSFSAAEMPQALSAEQLLCVESLGCFYTPVTAEALAILFPDAALFSAQQPLDPAGSWEILHYAAALDCPTLGLSEELPDQSMSMVLQTGGDVMALYAAGAIYPAVLSPEPEALALYEIAPGLYVSSVAAEGDIGYTVTSYFIAIQDESSFTGMVIGSMNLDDGLMTHRCSMNRAIDGILVG